MVNKIGNINLNSSLLKRRSYRAKTTYTEWKTPEKIGNNRKFLNKKLFNDEIAQDG